MKHYQLITCPFCNNDNVVKNGHNPNGGHRWHCNCCKKSFQLAYTTFSCKSSKICEICKHKKRPHVAVRLDSA
ncbi:MAG: hypothetical protein LBJ57_08445 [Prevotellaceae bacterium]|nr:hypothetical protein [Prevotellaceae bacterium]